MNDVIDEEGAGRILKLFRLSTNLAARCNSTVYLSE